MKKPALLFGALCILLLSTLQCFAQSKTLNVYTWADFLPPAIVQQFEKETDITVYITEYENNETLYAKLKIAKNPNYDVIFPSSYFMPKLIKANLLQKLDKKSLSNFKHLDPQFLNQVFDPNNTYSVPYLWTTVGIIVNKRYHDPNKIKGWKDFWKPEFENQILLLDESRDIFSMALFVSGYSINEKDPTHIKDAFNSLITLLPNVRLFNTATIPNVYIDEDITIGMAWSGEAYHGIQENPDLAYIYPQEGFPISLDCIAIPATAQNPQNAISFINFLLRPDIAAKLTIHTGGGTPNLTAKKHLPDEIRNNSVINPSQEILKRGKFQLDLEEANVIYEKYWELLKVSA